MFGFGRGSKQDDGDTLTANRLFELVYFPDGQIVERGWSDVDTGGWGRPEDGKIDGSFAVGDAQCRIDATLRDGNAILSTWADGKIVTSALLLSSPDEASNQSLLALFLRSTRNLDLVQALAPGQDDIFSDVETATERPFLGTLLTPAPTRDLTDALLAVQRQWAAAVIGN